MMVAQTIDTMLSHPDPLPSEPGEVETIDGPGPDETPMHEQAEPTEPMEPAQPPGPSVDVAAMIQAMGLQSQHHGAMASSISELAHSLGKPRTKIPVRDKAGNITHVIDKMDE